MTRVAHLGYQDHVEGIIAIIMIFGMPVFIVGITSFFKYRRLKLMKQAELAKGADRKQLEAIQQDRAQLEERVQNLETIVCSVDLELNARLNKLAAHQSYLALPPAAGTTAETKKDGKETEQGQATAATLAYQATSGAVSVGTTLMDRFHVEKVLGHGGMGAVYLANDTQIGEQVALKVMTHNVAEDPDSVQRFRREASAARKITHSNVIRIHDIGNDAGLLFLSMEYFQGMTLADLLARRHVVPLGEARQILGQVCDALTAAHGAGVVHRDLKPQNILVNEQRAVKVIDFGLAKATYMRGMTATGMILGTPEYMAPEQIQGGSVDHRTDIYALGAVAFQVLTGRPPFVADTPIAVGFKHCSEPPSSPRQLNPDLPESLSAAILKCLAKGPDDRFNSASVAKAALLA